MAGSPFAWRGFDEEGAEDDAVEVEDVEARFCADAATEERTLLASVVSMGAPRLARREGMAGGASGAAMAGSAGVVAFALLLVGLEVVAILAPAVPFVFPVPATPFVCGTFSRLVVALFAPLPCCC